MAISFPSSPSTNDVYEYNSIKYVFDGVKWIASGKSFFDLNTGLLSDGTVVANALTVDTDTLYIDSANDRVGVGTSSPANDLEVVAGTPSIKCRATADSASQLILDNARAEDVIGGRLIAQWNGSTVSRIDFRNGTDAINQDDGSIAFSTSESGASPVERMRILSSGLTFNGDTAAANALDDYEEGTWTGGIAGGTTAGSYTYTNATCYYVKIGRQVTATFNLIGIDSSSAGSGTLLVTGLPFASTADAYGYAYGPVVLSRANVADTTVTLTSGLGTSVTQLNIQETRDAAAQTLVLITDLDYFNNPDIKGTITYFTDA